MPLEARKTKFAVFSLNRELSNLINSALKWISSLNKHKRTDIKTTAEGWSIAFLRPELFWMDWARASYMENRLNFKQTGP